MPTISLASITVVEQTPSLSNSSATQTGETTATGTVDTDSSTGTLYFVATANSSESAATVRAGSSQAVNGSTTQNVSITGLTASTTYYIHYLHEAAGATVESTVSSSPSFTTASGSSTTISLSGITVSAASSGVNITSVTTTRLGETVTITTDGATDLSAAITLTATYGGVALTGKANVTASSVDFTAPSGGLQVDANHDYVLTADAVDSAAFSSVLLAPSGKGLVTLTGVHVASFLNLYAGDGSTAIGSGDQVLFDNFTTDNKAVAVDSTGLPTITNGNNGTNQVFDWYYLDAQDSYTKSVVQTLTVLATSDQTKPVISLVGENPVTVAQNSVYVDAGATAIDDVDGVITDNIVTTNTVDTSSTSTQYVYYNVADSGGNAADQVVRTVNITAANTPATGQPVIIGTVQQNEILSVDVSGIADVDGLGDFSYQWIRDSIDLVSATEPTYTLGYNDVGSVMSVRVSFTDGGSTAESVTSEVTSAVVNINIDPTGSVSIDNASPEVGDTLTASNTVADVNGVNSSAYQWLRSGQEISGETASTYTTTVNDLGAQISVRFDYVDDFGAPDFVTSSQTSAVIQVDVPDVVAPVLSSPATSNVGAYGASGSVSTTRGDGRLYFIATANASETAATIKASDENVPVEATGTTNITIPGLTPETSYYLHFVQDGANDVESNVVVTTQFTTPAATGGGFNDYAEWMDSLPDGSWSEKLRGFFEGKGYSGSTTEMQYEYLKTVSSKRSNSERYRDWKNGGFN